jgi:hypothetical protein
MSVDDREIEALFDGAVREMRPAFEAQLLELARAGSTTTGSPMTTSPVEVEVDVRPRERRVRMGGRRSLALVGAGAVVLAGVIAVSVVRDPQVDDLVPVGSSPVTEASIPNPVPATEPPASSAPAPSATPATSSASEVSDAIDADPQLEWRRADAGSMARSQVWKAIAGPVGFVAIGMGFDDGANQGRVWFSVDGSVWEEPALGVFDTLAVWGVAATSEAYFVLASPNPDRVAAGDPGLYRSTDGRTWLPVETDLPRDPRIGSAAGGLVMTGGEPGQFVLRWSADGESWADAAIDLSQTDLIDLELPNDADAEVSYLRGLSSDLGELQIFSSVDGRNWSLLPAPPIGGPFAASANGLTLIANPDEQRCGEEVSEGLNQPDPSDPAWMERLLEQQWSCAAVLQLTTYDRSTQAWSAPADGPGPAPITGPIVWTGTGWVAPLIGSDRSMTVWTAASDGTDWNPVEGTRLEFDDNGGSPQMPVAAAGHGKVIVITPDRLVGEQTVVLVGE